MSYKHPATSPLRREYGLEVGDRCSERVQKALIHRRLAAIAELMERTDTQSMCKDFAAQMQYLFDLQKYWKKMAQYMQHFEGSHGNIHNLNVKIPGARVKRFIA